MFKKIVKNVYYCGLNDCDRKFFDELIPLEKGTSYNSYLIRGSEKTALIDTMYPPKSEEYLASFDENGIKKVDYIIANHGEQDHTGSIPLLLKKYPEALVVTNAVCKNNIVNMLNVAPEKFIVIENLQELPLGDKTLKFISAPGVHWPDTMFTYLLEDNLLFTCDFLGAHYTFDDIFVTPSSELEMSAKKYYAEIMMPFRLMCKRYTAKIKEMKVDMVLPSHGPVYKNPDYILNLYEDWTKDEAHNSVLLPYVSMYKSTEEMIDYLDKKLKAANIETVKFDMVRGNVAKLVTALVDANTIIMGAPMVLATAHPVALNVATLINALKPKVKNVGFVGSFGWGGKLEESLEESLKNIKCNKFPSVIIKGKPKTADFEILDELANKIIEAHKAL